MSALTDQDVASAVAGEPAGLRHVYEVLAPGIAGYLRSRGSVDPEGLTQDVFVTLLPRLSKLRGGTHGLRTLAFSIAHARLVDEMRRRAKRPAATRFEPDDDPRMVPSAEDGALVQLQSDETVVLLAGLNEAQRTVLGLRLVGQLTLEETAEVTGKSIGAVKQLQRRGLLALRERLQSREGVTQ
jgi:RNA polymerase sigma-70 factor (ECF subfamily)